MKFQINIYRPGRKPKKVPKPKGEERRISVAIIIPLIFLLLVGIILLPKWGFMDASSSLDRRMHMNRRQKTYLIDVLSKAEEDLKKATKERELISSLQVKRIEWSQKLVDLSEIMPDDLWLTDLSLKTIEKRTSKQVQEETYLTIKGVSVPMAGREPLDSIARLILSLNGLDSFKRDFEPVKLMGTKLSRKERRELMEFELSSRLKGGPGVSPEKGPK